MVDEIGWARCIFSVGIGNGTRVLILDRQPAVSSFRKWKSFHRIVSISIIGCHCYVVSGLAWNVDFVGIILVF